jgi:hypothetical protein
MASQLASVKGVSLMSLPTQSSPSSAAEQDNMAKHVFQELHVMGNIVQDLGGDFQNGRHIYGNIGSAPTAAAGANNGTAPPSPVVTAGATDNRGNITFGSGSSPAAGAQCVVTFATPYLVAPVGIAFIALNTGTQALGMYVTSITTTGFTVSTTNACAASQGATIYSFNYLVIA